MKAYIFLSSMAFVLFSCTQAAEEEKSEMPSHESESTLSIDSAVVQIKTNTEIDSTSIAQTKPEEKQIQVLKYITPTIEVVEEEEEEYYPVKPAPDEFEEELFAPEIKIPIQDQ